MRTRKQIYKGRLLTLETERRRLPNGHTVTLEIVRHPGASLIVPFVEKDKLVLLKQFRPVIRAYLYELPAGTLNKNETPRACAAREVIEETGFRARRLTRLGVIYPVPGYSTERIVVWRADGLQKVSSRVEADEVIETVLVTRRQLRAHWAAGRIVDAKTICGLAFCGWL